MSTTDVHDPDGGLGEYVAEDDGELDPSETLEADPGQRDPEQGAVDAPERYRAATAFGTTSREQREGQSLSSRLREEEPDVYYDSDTGVDEQRELAEGDDPDDDWAGSRSRLDGVLMASDGGLGPDLSEDQVGTISAEAEGNVAAEDAAMHVVDGS